MKNLFENYNKDEMNSLLWDMYKGWFLHSVADLDSDKMVDMLLFYDEVKNLLKELPLPDTKNLE